MNTKKVWNPIHPILPGTSGAREEWIWPESDKDHVYETLVQHWEKHSVAYKKYVPQFRVCIQAGGNCGMYPYGLSYMFERVYTFEPDPLNFYCLSYNCRRRENIFKIQAALGAFPGTCSIFHRDPPNPGAHIAVYKGDNRFIPVLRIDDLHVECCDFIQLDVETAEETVLKGATRILSYYRPVVSVERTNDRITELLSSFGYKFKETVVEDSIYATI